MEVNIKMGSSIDVKKLSPSPQLAAILGFTKGLNAKKKELEEKETAEAKKAIDWYKAFTTRQATEGTLAVSQENAQTNRLNAMTNMDNADTNRMNIISMKQDRVEKIELARQNLNLALDNHTLDVRKFDLEMRTKSSRYLKMAAEIEANTKWTNEEKRVRLEAALREEVNKTADERLFANQKELERMRGGTAKEVAGMNISSREKVAGMNIESQEARTAASLDMQYQIAEMKDKQGTSKDGRVNTYNKELLDYTTELDKQFSATEKKGKEFVPKPLSEDTIKILENRYKSLKTKYDILTQIAPEGTISEPPAFASKPTMVDKKKVWRIIPRWLKSPGQEEVLGYEVGGAGIQEPTPDLTPVQSTAEEIKARMPSIKKQANSTNPSVIRQFLINEGENPIEVDKALRGK